MITKLQSHWMELIAVPLVLDPRGDPRLRALLQGLTLPVLTF